MLWNCGIIFANGFVAPQSIRRPNLSYKTKAVHYELAIRLQNYRCQEYNSMVTVSVEYFIYGTLILEIVVSGSSEARFPFQITATLGTWNHLVKDQVHWTSASQILINVLKYQSRRNRYNLSPWVIGALKAPWKSVVSKAVLIHFR